MLVTILQICEEVDEATVVSTRREAFVVKWSLVMLSVMSVLQLTLMGSTNTGV